MPASRHSMARASNGDARASTPNDGCAPGMMNQASKGASAHVSARSRLPAQQPTSLTLACSRPSIDAPADRTSQSSRSASSGSRYARTSPSRRATLTSLLPVSRASSKASAAWKKSSSATSRRLARPCKRCSRSNERGDSMVEAMSPFAACAQTSRSQSISSVSVWLVDLGIDSNLARFDHDRPADRRINPRNPDGFNRHRRRRKRPDPCGSCVRACATRANAYWRRR